MKKKVFIVGILLLLLGVVLFIFWQMEEKVEKVEEKEEVLSTKEQLVSKLKDEEIDLSFIDWIEEEYPSALSELLLLLENNPYDENMWHKATGYSYLVLNDFYLKKYDSMDNVQVLDTNNPAVLSFVGDVSLADNWAIMPKYDERGKGIYGILSEDVVDVMKKSDLMVANSEFTVSNRGRAMPGKLYTFRARPERLAIYEEMGVDLVTLANNHVYDFGGDAFLDMLDSFHEYQIPHIGAGRNLEEASRPYYFIINGYKVAFLSATRAEKYVLTPEATETQAGVFYCYDPTNMIQQIKKVREESDYVISLIHFGREGSHELEKEQVESARMYIEAGSDIVIGHHAHTLQGIEFYNHKPIIYNLGNFIFNSEVDDTVIFQMILNEEGNLSYKMLPALQKNEYTDLLIGDGKLKVIQDLNSWSSNAFLDEDGVITEKSQ